MNVRTPVFVYAVDPVSQAGLEQILRADPGVLVLASDRIDAAAVAVVGVDDVDEEAVRLIAEGRDTAEIAGALSYSERTVKGVIHEVTSRLQLRNRSHVVAFALRND